MTWLIRPLTGEIRPEATLDAPIITELACYCLSSVARTEEASPRPLCYEELKKHLLPFVLTSFFSRYFWIPKEEFLSPASSSLVELTTGEQTACLSRPLGELSRSRSIIRLGNLEDSPTLLKFFSSCSRDERWLEVLFLKTIEAYFCC